MAYLKPILTSLSKWLKLKNIEQHKQKINGQRSLLAHSLRLPALSLHTRKINSLTRKLAVKAQRVCWHTDAATEQRQKQQRQPQVAFSTFATVAVECLRKADVADER